MTTPMTMIEEIGNDLWGAAENTWEGMDFSAIPTGDYSVVIDEAKFAYTSGDVPKGHYSIRLTVLDGQFKNRKIYKKLWVQSQNADYVRGCYSFLKQLYMLLGQPLPAAAPNDQELFALVNKPFNARIIKKNGKDMNGNVVEENEVAKVSPYQAIAAASQGQAAPQADMLIPF